MAPADRLGEPSNSGTLADWQSAANPEMSIRMTVRWRFCWTAARIAFGGAHDNRQSLGMRGAAIVWNLPRAFGACDYLLRSARWCAIASGDVVSSCGRSERNSARLASRLAMARAWPTRRRVVRRRMLIRRTLSSCARLRVFPRRLHRLGRPRSLAEALGVLKSARRNEEFVPPVVPNGVCHREVPQPVRPTSTRKRRHAAPVVSVLERNEPVKGRGRATTADLDQSSPGDDPLRKGI